MIPLVVLPLVAFGRWVRRLSRDAQDTLAEASAYASELIGASRTVQAFTNERLATQRFGGEVERSYVAARDSTKARAVLTAIIIFIIFTSVVGILWVGSHDVLTGQISAGTLSQFILYAVFAAGALGELSQVWGEVSAASGAAERLFEILRVKPEIAAPAHPRALPGAAARRRRAEQRALRLSDAAGDVRAGRHFAARAPGREGRDRRPVRRGQEHAVSPAVALLRSVERHDHARRRRRARRRPDRGAQANRAGAAGLGGLRRQRARQHPLRPARRQRRRDRTAQRSSRTRPSSSACCRRVSTRRSASAA